MPSAPDHRWAAVALVWLGLLGVAAAQAGATDGAGPAADLVLVVVGFEVARWAARTDPPATTWRTLLRDGAVPALVALSAFALYAQVTADAAELARLRGAVLWTLAGAGDLHAATSTDRGWMPVDGLPAGGTLWLVAAALRFSVIWWLATRLALRTRWHRTALLPVAAVALVAHLLAVATLHGIDGAGRAAGAVELRSAGLLVGALAASLPSSLAARLRDGAWTVRLAAVALVWSVALPVDGGRAGALGSLLAATGAALLLLAAGGRRSPAWPTPRTVGLLAAAALPTTLLLGPVTAIALHADVPPAVATTAGLCGAAALGLATALAGRRAVPADADPEIAALWVVPALALALMALWGTTGGLGWEPPRFVETG